MTRVKMIDVPGICSYHLCTAGEDHTVDVWDIRRRGRIYTIPSHSNLVSHLKFQRESENN